MTEDINKAYIQRYVAQAQTTDSQALKNDALYRVGTYIDVIECSSDGNLTPEQQQTVLNAAARLLGGENA
jgi:hypothetical protein